MINTSTLDSVNISSKEEDLNSIEEGQSEKIENVKINYKEFYEDLKESVDETDRQKILVVEQLIEAQRVQEEESNHQKARQNALQEQLYRQFRIIGDTFHFKDQPETVAFKDKGERVVTASHEDRVTQAMVTMAEIKGWQTIKVSGHAEFQQKVWMEANLRGIEVQGYKPTEQDRKQLEETRDRRMKNTIRTVSDEATQHQQTADSDAVVRTTTVPSIAPQTQKSIDPSHAAVQTNATQKETFSAKTEQTEALKRHTGRVLDHGEAPYAHDPENRKSYFVKLATDKGTAEVWGVDLKRALSKEEVNIGDRITLKLLESESIDVPVKNEKGETEWISKSRNTWDVSIHEKAKVVEAVASTLIEAHVQNPAHREVLKEAIHARTMEREKTNDVPTVSVYDKQAPTLSPVQDRTHPVPEQNIERTR